MSTDYGEDRLSLGQMVAGFRTVWKDWKSVVYEARKSIMILTGAFGARTSEPDQLLQAR